MEQGLPQIRTVLRQPSWSDECHILDVNPATFGYHSSNKKKSIFIEADLLIYIKKKD